MHILSIDVGIKNLAHCLIKIVDNSYKIILWDSINLAEELQPMCEFINKKPCNQIAKFSNNDKCFCTKHSKTLSGNLTKIKDTDISDIPLPKIGVELKKKYDFIFKDIHIDTVIIENQISPLASRMKTLQGMITQYFINNNISDIQYISATNKLKDYTDEKLTYLQRKKFSIETVGSIICNQSDWHHIFINSKKDDLSDTLLQVIYYIKKYNLINT